MRKLKLQMNITVDGFVADSEGKLDWMLPEVDKKQIKKLQNLTQSTDTIILGRVMATEAIPYWENAALSKKKMKKLNMLSFLSIHQKSFLVKH